MIGERVAVLETTMDHVLQTLGEMRQATGKMEGR